MYEGDYWRTNTINYEREVIDIMILVQILLRWLRGPSFYDLVALVVYLHI